MDYTLFFEEGNDLETSYNKRFQEYYIEAYDCAYQSAYKIVKNAWITEDIVSQTFLKLYQRFPLYQDRDISQFKALCRVCAKNEAIDYIRHENSATKIIAYYKQEQLIISKEGLPEKEVLRKEKINSINHTFHSLPASYQEILLLKYEEGLSVSQIANQLNINTKNAEVRLQRARNKFRTLLSSALLIAVLLFSFIQSEVYANLNDYVISKIVNKYFLVTTMQMENNESHEMEMLTCNFIPAGYILTQEVQREDISFLQYTQEETGQIFFVDRIIAGIDYQLDYDSYHLTMTNNQNDFAIFFDAKDKVSANSFLWYDKEQGFVYSITYTASLEELKEIALEIK